ncbi:MAG: type II secretion system minor pseudopilin GspI [Betaproteobacteria bacterium]|nr:type II secretion system minor pseudopilin GspI [Betaproteobacteria bacterium]
MRQRGFTLIEVLIALFVLAVTLASSMRALSVVTRTGSDLPPRFAAQLSADNALAVARLNDNWPGLGVYESECPQGDWELHCQLTVSATPNPSIRRLEVVVTETHDKSILATVVTIMANRGGHVL